MKDMILDALGQAFDEGFASPYEMKDDVIHRISADFRKAKMDFSTSKPFTAIASSIEKQLPAFMRTWLSHYAIWLCGGAIVKLCTDPTGKGVNWKSSDYDFYCTEDELKKIKLDISPSNEGYGAKENRKTFKGAFQGYLINFITADHYVDADSCIRDFDLSIVRFAFTLKPQPTLHGFKQSWQDLLMNQIRLVDGNKSSTTVNRIKKYVKRGFRDMTGLVEKGVLQQFQKFDLT